MSAIKITIAFIISIMLSLLILTLYFVVPVFAQYYLGLICIPIVFLIAFLIILRSA
jgi:hypothetical protein